MLAQTLVRRDLFPNSDCLKAGQREDMLTREILTYDPDIACLQEVDRLEKHLPVFSKAGYAHVYASGPAKRHGCLILYKEEMFEKGVEKTVFYDDTDLTQFLDGPSHILEDLKDPAIFSQPPMSPRIGSSIKTKNIASIVALARKDGHPGCVIATTHTFWHPNLQDSRVIHVSRDASVATTHPAVGAREDEDEGAAAAASESTGDGLENHPDRIITNARPARPEDGLLTDAELLQLYQGGGRKTALRSGYDEALAAVPQESDNVYGAREPSAIYGRNEPMYTSFTHYWRLTLDPTEIGDHPRSDVVVGVLKPHRKKDLGDGLPMRGHLPQEVSKENALHKCSISIFGFDERGQNVIPETGSRSSVAVASSPLITSPSGSQLASSRILIIMFLVVLNLVAFHALSTMAIPNMNDLPDPSKDDTHPQHLFASGYDVRRIMDTEPELRDRETYFKPTAYLIAIPDPRPQTAICMYALRASVESGATLAWMETTRRSKSDVDRGIEVLEHHSSGVGHSDYYGKTEVYAESINEPGRAIETRIFQYPISGVLLSDTLGWSTFVSEDGEILDESKSVEDCIRFFEYVGQTIATEVTISDGNLPRYVNTLITPGNLIFQPQFTPREGHVTDAVRFISWTGSKEFPSFAVPRTDDHLRDVALAPVRRKFLDNVRRVCRVPTEGNVPAS
ncbi:hypothetical protein FRB97_007558 [Tulasnella sp. 331]|nr:hypothetical protein FRB97_007558 [Tulasnella sp. 331]